MSVIISRNFVATATGDADINANNPLIGWENIVTINNVTATTEETDYPATNLANPATNLGWRAASQSPTDGDVFVTVIIDRTEPVDYVAIAKHNLGTSQIPVSVEGLIDLNNSPQDWVELVQDTLLATDGPALFRFEPQSLYAVRLRFQVTNTLPRVAVLYAGKLLILQRRIYVGHMPITYARRAKITNARSESGNFLGRVVLNEFNETAVTMSNITPSWYRTNMVPFVLNSKEFPFFFAWRPSAYPQEVGYCWMTNDPMPSNQRVNGMMQFDLKMNGVV